MRPRIVSEFSAQRRTHPPSPALNDALLALKEIRKGSGDLGNVADIGCGKLRHYEILRKRATKLYLVDTERQLSAMHKDGKTTYSVRQVAETARARGSRVFALTIQEFAQSRVSIDFAFCIAVFDVVTQDVRQAITAVIADKLSAKGYLVLIIPRNDSTITGRCFNGNRYKDGHVFEHHGLQTFFCNFKNYRSVISDCTKVGLRMVRDLSYHRQICLILRK